MSGGYCNCACRDCFDIAINDEDGEPALCNLCEWACCDVTGESECERDDAYGADGLCEHGNWVCSVEGCENNHKEQGQ